METDPKKYDELRKRLLVLEASVRGTLQELDQLFGPSKVNVEFLAKPTPQVIPTPAANLNLAAARLAGDVVGQPFDMEAAIKRNNLWECNDLHCRNCTPAQNKECLSTYSIRVPMGASGYHAPIQSEPETAAKPSTRTPLPVGVREYNPKDTYKKGDIIQHHAFGQGKVTNVTITPRSSNMDVDFNGTKKNIGFGRK